MNPCDIVFSDSIPILASVLKIFGEPWGHVSLAVGNGEFIGAEAEGITKRQMHPWEIEKHEVLRHPLLSNGCIASAKILEWANSKVGLPIYDYAQLLGFALNLDVHHDGWWVCSAFVYEAYRQAGIQLLNRIKPWMVRTQHLYYTPGLESVEGR